MEGKAVSLSLCLRSTPAEREKAGVLGPVTPRTEASPFPSSKAAT